MFWRSSHSTGPSRTGTTGRPRQVSTTSAAGQARSSIAGGHENYFDELAAILRDSNGRPDKDEIDALDRKNDITMLTQLHDGQ